MLLTKGDRLKEVRSEKKLTQIQMADKFDIRQQSYREYENGNRKFNGDFLIKMYELFDINPLWLLTGIGEKHTSDGSNNLSQEELLNQYSYKLENINNSINVNESIDLLQKGHALVPEFNEQLKVFIYEKSLFKLFHENKTLWETIKSSLVPDNKIAFLFIKVLKQMDTRKFLTDNYKSYLLHEVSEYKTNIFYTERDKSALLDLVNSLEEQVCEYILKNLDTSIQNNERSIDVLTRFVEEKIIKIDVDNIFVRKGDEYVLKTKKLIDRIKESF